MAVSVFGNSSNRVGVGFQQVASGVGVMGGDVNQGNFIMEGNVNLLRFFCEQSSLGNGVHALCAEGGASGAVGCRKSRSGQEEKDGCEDEAVRFDFIAFLHQHFLLGEILFFL